MHAPAPQPAVTDFSHWRSLWASLRAEWRQLAVLAAAVLLFLAPALLRWEGLLYDDSAAMTFLRLTGVARSVQQGGIPLWDFSTYCGARPFYMTPDPPIYNPLFYPFFLLADLDNLEQCFTVLFLLPLTLFILMGAGGAYAFSRLVLGLSRWPAAAAGFLYAIGGHFTLSVISLHEPCIMGWWPWVLLAAARFLAGGSVAWWCLGAVLAALMSCASMANTAIRVYAVSGFIIFACWVPLFFGTRTRASRLRMGLRLPLTAAMFALSLGLSAFFWSGAWDGIHLLLDGNNMSYEQIVTSEATASMPPSNLMTLFLPDFYGSLEFARGVWGTGLRIQHLQVLGGGLFSGFLVLAFLRYRLGRREDEPRETAWGWVALLVLAGTLLTLMGRYTPYYLLECTLLPALFEVPYPYYFRFGFFWALTVLLGLALGALARDAEFRARICRCKAPLVYLLGVITCAALLLAEPFPVPGHKYVMSFRTLTALHAWPAFLAQNLPYLAIAATALIGGTRFLSPARFAILLTAGILAESVFFSYQTLYRNQILPATGGPAPLCRWEQTQRFRSPSEHPRYRLLEKLRTTNLEGMRWIGNSAQLDNFAWASGTRAALGYDAKPLIPEMNQALDTFLKGQPYVLWSLAYPENFLRNMNVGWLFAEEGLVDSAGIRRGMVHGMPSILLRDPATLPQNIDRDTLVSGKGLEAYKLPVPLPYVYTQDRLLSLEQKEQMDKLLRNDLRAAAFVDPSVAAQLPGRILTEPPGRDAIFHFEELQAQNRILKVEQRPNRLAIEADITTPAVLVVAETFHDDWQVRVDGTETDYWPVNFLQMGLWLPEGRHTIEFHFRPKAVLQGLTISAACWTLWLGIAVGAGILHAVRKRTRGSGAGNAS